MSNPIGMVFVFPEGARPVGAVAAMTKALEAAARPGPPDLADLHVASSDHPMGFDLLSVCFSPNALLDVGAHALAVRLEEMFVEAVRSLHPMAAYYTTYNLHFDEDWLEQQVFMPLLMEEHATLWDGPYHLLAVPAAVLPRGGATLLAHTSELCVWRRDGRGPNPYGGSGD